MFVSRTISNAYKSPRYLSSISVTAQRLCPTARIHAASTYLPKFKRHYNGNSASGATACVFSVSPTAKDPYRYQVGFGNRFASEAIPGALPIGQNSPQSCKYDLYAEQMTGSTFTAPRAMNQNAWLYRIRPAVAHQGFTKLPQNPELENNFIPGNLHVHVSPTQQAWRPIDIPTTGKVNFVDGLKTFVGSGNPAVREGVAIHMYAANTSMGNTAFCNNDGDLLILPQQGRLDIQSEFGKLMVRPGELAVVQRGIRFRVALPDGPSRGYVHEIYGTHYELPELGPIGANGLANTRDFESPVASFDLDQGPWDIIHKVCGELHVCKQDHTPFDVVAWHGNYVPYKYDLEKFIYIGSNSKDHIDPSIFCVLTARSKAPGIPLADFLVIGPRWDVASQTFRPPYYHRNSSTEFIGLLTGGYEGRSDAFQPGGCSYDPNFCPHGVSYDEFKKATEAELLPMRVMEGTIVIVFESSMMLTISDFAMKSPKRHEHEPKMWNNLKGQFMNHIPEVNAALRAAGLAPLGQKN